MLNVLRTTLHKVISSPTGDTLALIRVPRQIAQDLNAILGEPLCSAEELAKREAGGKRLAELRSQPRVVGPSKGEPAPVMVYFEKDRNQRELTRILEVLGAQGITPKMLDVTDDLATIAFVTREAKCERDELPVVFAGGAAIGKLTALIAADTRGELKRAVFGK